MKTRKLLFVVLLLSMVLTACGGGSSGGDKPVDAVKGVVKAMEKLDVSEARKYVCAAHKDAIPDLESDLAELEELGIDAEKFLDAMKVEMSDMKYEEKSKDDDKAVVHVSGKIVFDIDLDALRPLFAELFESMGLEPTDEMLDEMMADFAGDMGEEATIDGDVNLVKEGDDWLVCDDLEFLNALDSGF